MAKEITRVVSKQNPADTFMYRGKIDKQQKENYMLIKAHPAFMNALQAKYPQVLDGWDFLKIVSQLVGVNWNPNWTNLGNALDPQPVAMTQGANAHTYIATFEQKIAEARAAGRIVTDAKLRENVHNFVPSEFQQAVYTTLAPKISAPTPQIRPTNYF